VAQVNGASKELLDDTEPLQGCDRIGENVVIRGKHNLAGGLFDVRFECDLAERKIGTVTTGQIHGASVGPADTRLEQGFFAANSDDYVCVRRDIICLELEGTELRVSSIMIEMRRDKVDENRGDIQQALNALGLAAKTHGD
jgi:hypothetical protein